MVTTVPIGVGATQATSSAKSANSPVSDPEPALRRERELRLPWYSRSIDSTYLTGKRVFIFADATHALCAAAQVAREDELGFEVVGLGTYSPGASTLGRSGLPRRNWASKP